MTMSPSTEKMQKKAPSPSNASVSDQTVQTYATGTSSAASVSEVSSLENNDAQQFHYKATSSEASQVALKILRERLSGRLGAKTSELRLSSMNETFDLELLTQFYDELMIPNFPLEEERDDLEDWLEYLSPAKSGELSEDGPSMDVLILHMDGAILGGIAFEYYPQARAGLLSYMVVSTEFRRLGILATLHPVFCQALQSLHEVSSGASTKIHAILAETNTTTAGDVPVEVARKRHAILFKLGYRLLEFPYVQPPLAPDVGSFDDIMLLVYKGEADMQSMSTEVLHNYVLDFYHSVFGYNSLDFQDHWYYQLVTWYAKRYPSTKIQQDLPWEDVTPRMNELKQIEDTS